MDNLRFLLIFLVVLGHFLAFIPGAGSLYRIIYLFHMPAFLFLTGYFSHFHGVKILTDLLYPYVVFQVLYLLFDAFVLRQSPLVHLQFTVPYWLLWYLLDLIFCRLLIPLADKVPRLLRLPAVLASVGLALVCGYVPEFGYYLSIGRFFAFFPFFLAGYYLAQSRWFPAWLEQSRLKQLPFALAGVVVALLSCLRESRFSPEMLYGAVPYPTAHFGPGTRLLITGFGFGWILALLLLTPRCHLPGITRLGQNTLPIYLLHGFVVRLAGRVQLFRFSLWANLALALILSAGLVALLGHPRTRKPFRTVFTGGWVETLWRKYIL